MSVQWGVSDLDAAFWGDLSLLGDGLPGGRFTIHTLEGWEDLPDAREGWEARPNGHGTFDAPVWADARRIRIAGTCVAAEDRDNLLHELKRNMVFPSNPQAGLRDLTITLAGRTLTAGTRLVRFKPAIVAEHWPVGVFGWAAEWVAPDPLRYGPEETVVTGLPTPSGGLRFDLFGNRAGVLDFGAIPEDGMITLVNEGSADTHPVFEVHGPLVDFSLTETITGNRVEFVGTIPGTSVLTLDPATGVATLDGVADRSGRLTRREWVPVPAGGVSRWTFASSKYDAAARLTARVKAAYW